RHTRFSRDWSSDVCSSDLRGLLYHYFPTKRDFFAAVVERESERMLRMTAAVPGVPVREQLAAGLGTYLEYVREHAHGYRAFHRRAEERRVGKEEVYCGSQQ